MFVSPQNKGPSRQSSISKVGRTKGKQSPADGQQSDGQYKLEASTNRSVVTCASLIVEFCVDT